MSFTSADQRCPNCQHLNPPGTLTCATCGLALTDAAPTPHDHSRAPLYDFPPQPSATFAAFQPPSQPAPASAHRLRGSPKVRLLLLAALVVLALSGAWPPMC